MPRQVGQKGGFTGQNRKSVGSPEVRICSEMVIRALDDMRRGRFPQYRISSVAWLVSSAATRWFDYVGIDQHSALEGCDWISYAHELMADASIDWGKARPDYLAVILAGIRHLDPT